MSNTSPKTKAHNLYSPKNAPSLGSFVGILTKRGIVLSATPGHARMHTPMRDAWCGTCGQYELVQLI